METSFGHTGIMDVALAVLLSIGCVISLPIYWWIFVTPIIHLIKRARKQPARRIL